MCARLDQARQRFLQLQQALQLLNPEAVLERGFAILRDSSGRIVRDSQAVAPGADLQATLAHGRLSLRVEGRSPE
jgi:exodeoxyribonuclease VII large subunit